MLHAGNELLHVSTQGTQHTVEQPISADQDTLLTVGLPFPNHGTQLMAEQTNSDVLNNQLNSDLKYKLCNFTTKLNRAMKTHQVSHTIEAHPL